MVLNAEKFIYELIQASNKPVLSIADKKESLVTAPKNEGQEVPETSKV